MSNEHNFRWHLLRILGTVAIVLGFGGGMLRGAEARRAETPNIVCILADDMGYGDLSCQNPESKIATPNLDRLAEQGVRFTDAHSPSSLGRGTRYGLLTDKRHISLKTRFWAVETGIRVDAKH